MLKIACGSTNKIGGEVKYKTQNPIYFAVTILLVSLLFTCIPFGPPDDDEYTWTDVEYSPDGSITIYLDGSAPVRHSRALTLEHAKLGHDFFEVAFHHPASNTVARAVWETGHAAGVSGVVRNIDYASAFSSGATLTSTQGAAVIFAGKKSDRTLLGVGKLYKIDGVEVAEDGPAFIGPDVKKVTFGVAALESGVHEDPVISSFKTNAKQGGDISNINTDIIPVKIGIKDFSLFRLDAGAEGGQTVNASYQLGVFEADFNDYKNGIFRGGQMEVVFPLLPEYRIPRYSLGDGTWETSRNSIVQYLDVDRGTYETAVVPGNNTTGNTTLENPVLFTIGPTHSDNDGKVFAFSFEIPVYPLTNYDGRASSWSWYIRPGYDSYLYDLDDGLGGSGGAFLIGTGQFLESVSHSLTIRKKPDKTRYNNLGGNFNLDLTGMQVYLNIGNQGTPVGNIPLTSGDLYFIIGDTVVEAGDDIQALLAAWEKDGIVEVTVEYYHPDTVKPGTGDGLKPYIVKDQPEPPAPPTLPRLIRNDDYNGGRPYTATLNLYYFILTSGTITSPLNNNRYIIVNQEDANAMNGVFTSSSSGTYLFVFYNSFDLGGIVLNGGPYNIIIIAARPDIIIGRSNATGAINNNGLNTNYFLGVWPFDEILAVRGMSVNSQQFYINAAGRWTDVDLETETTTNNMGGSFIHGTGTININRSGVRVLNLSSLRP